MSRKGFSLIEMMFVFVLAGVIMAIGFPRLRSSLEKQNIRSARALLGTLAATARGTAVARGCNATLNMTVDSVWVTACAMTPPFAAVTRMLARGQRSGTAAAFASRRLERMRIAGCIDTQRLPGQDTLYRGSTWVAINRWAFTDAGNQNYRLKIVTTYKTIKNRV